jgi:hypothetical protein
MTACRTNVMRAFQFAAVCTFIRIARNQSIMGTTVSALGAGDFTFWDSHVTTFDLCGGSPHFSDFQGSGNTSGKTKKPPLYKSRENTNKFKLCKAFFTLLAFFG